MASVNSDYTKFTISGVYVTYALAVELLDSGYICNSPYVRVNSTWNTNLTAFYWDMVNDDLIILANTIVTPEDDLARACMLMPDNGVRLTYLNNL
ncbi:hypothetical protein nACB1_083 [Acinetobacter phage nACB1]|nr:hypothetical protein nACB1_083 [Acinetobacter phage nACB1]